MTKILLTGGSGFIAAHILEQLLQKGYTVVTTVRSEDKAQKIRDAHKKEADRLDVVIVPDISQDGAFDEVVKTPGLEVVMHTASPFHYKFTDGMTEVINPAVNGTRGILKAIQKSAPLVKRVIVTSSFAAILDEDNFENPNLTWTESSWNPVELEDISRGKATTYRVSKKLAERAAWDFVRDEQPSFDVATICPPTVLGPVVHHLATLDAINTSNERVVALLQGKWKDHIPDNGPVDLWVGVADVALAHVRAMERPEAGGKRFFTTAGRFANREIVDIVREKFPEFADRLPPKDIKGGEPNDRSKYFGYNNDATTETLGIKWTSLEDSITGLVKTLKDNGI